MTELKIELENGKYTLYTKKDDYRIFCDRGSNKEWVVFSAGSKMLLGFMYDYERLRERLIELEGKELNSEYWDKLEEERN